MIIGEHLLLQPKVSGRSATVNIITTLKNNYAGKKPVTLNTIIYDASGKEVGKLTAKTIVDNNTANSSQNTVKQSVIIAKP